MKRRDFLKLLGLSPVAPSLLMAAEKLSFQGALSETLYSSYSFEANYLNELRKFQIMMAERMANPACIIFPDGHIKSVTNEEIFIDN